MGQRVDTELVEGVLQLGKLDVSEEEVAGAGVADVEGGSEQPELAAELGQVEPGHGSLGLGSVGLVELWNWGSGKEDKNRAEY
jgi:hypothetical protein